MILGAPPRHSGWNVDQKLPEPRGFSAPLTVERNDKWRNDHRQREMVSGGITDRLSERAQVVAKRGREQERGGRIRVGVELDCIVGTCTYTRKIRQGKANQLRLKTTPFFSREKELPQVEFEPATFCILGRRSTN